MGYVNKGMNHSGMRWPLVWEQGEDFHTYGYLLIVMDVDGISRSLMSYASRWSRLGRESFTLHDTFGISPEWKLVQNH